MAIIADKIPTLKFTPMQKWSESTLEIDSDVFKPLVNAIAVLDDRDRWSQPMHIFWQNGFFMMSYTNQDVYVVKVIGKSGELHDDVVKLLPTWRLRLCVTAMKKPINALKKNVKLTICTEERGWSAISINGQEPQRYKSVDVVNCEELKDGEGFNHGVPCGAQVTLPRSSLMESIEITEGFTDNAASSHDHRNWPIYIRIRQGRVYFMATDSKRAVVHEPDMYVAESKESTADTFMHVWLKKAISILFDDEPYPATKLTPMKYPDEDRVSYVTIEDSTCYLAYAADMPNMYPHDRIYNAVFHPIEQSQVVEIKRSDIVKFLKVSKPFADRKRATMSVEYNDGVWSLYRTIPDLGEMRYTLEVDASFYPHYKKNGMIIKTNGEHLKDAIDVVYGNSRDELVRLIYGSNHYDRFTVSNSRTATSVMGFK